MIKNQVATRSKGNCGVRSIKPAGRADGSLLPLGTLMMAFGAGTTITSPCCRLSLRYVARKLGYLIPWAAYS